MAQTYDFFDRPFSTAWITPDGYIEFLRDGMLHDEFLSELDIIPPDVDYPSSYAISRLGFVKVSNPFQLAWSGKGRRGDPRMARAADYMAHAAVWLAESQHNPWSDDHSPGSLDRIVQRTPVFVTTVLKPDPRLPDAEEVEKMNVDDFIDAWGSRETSEFLYGKLLGEEFVRTVRLIERRILSHQTIKESTRCLTGDDLYRIIVRELRTEILSRS